MHLIFFTHPEFLGSQSMPRFAKMLMVGMKQRGHTIEVMTPQPLFYKLPLPESVMKWLGYIDQYIVFPFSIQKKLKTRPTNSLFVFTDHALGPWVPLVADRPHIIHCHDFLAQRSALGQIEENPTNWTGRLYQKYIHLGYSKGKNFISVSEKTKNDLYHFLHVMPSTSEVVYNGLNQNFVLQDQTEASIILGNKTGLDLEDGFILHVGGNQWYKNRPGVLKIYDAWRAAGACRLPLLMIGKEPSLHLKEVYEQCLYKADIHFFSDLDDEFVRKAYTGATVFLFPSLAEGFGWPIAEAMASGCPVITTDEAPMTEVAGNAGFYILRCPNEANKSLEWVREAAKVLDKVVKLSPVERKSIVEAGFKNSKRFNIDNALDKIEMIYSNVLQNQIKK